MAKDQPKPKPVPEDPVQSALDVVERATGEKLSDVTAHEKDAPGTGATPPPAT